MVCRQPGGRLPSLADLDQVRSRGAAAACCPSRGCCVPAPLLTPPSSLRSWPPLLPARHIAPLYRRYTAFIPLYPVGVVGEMWSVYQALPFIKQRGLRSVPLPNAANFAFDYPTFLVVSCFFLDEPQTQGCRRQPADEGQLACMAATASLIAWHACALLGGGNPCAVARRCSRRPIPPCCLQALMCVYPLLWFQLYSFLFRQRRKKLQPAGSAKKRN